MWRYLVILYDQTTENQNNTFIRYHLGYIGWTADITREEPFDSKLTPDIDPVLF